MFINAYQRKPFTTLDFNLKVVNIRFQKDNDIVCILEYSEGLEIAYLIPTIRARVKR